MPSRRPVWVSSPPSRLLQPLVGIGLRCHLGRLLRARSRAACRSITSPSAVASSRSRYSHSPAPKARITRSASKKLSAPEALEALAGLRERAQEEREREAVAP